MPKDEKGTNENNNRIEKRGHTKYKNGVLVLSLLLFQEQGSNKGC